MFIASSPVTGIIQGMVRSIVGGEGGVPGFNPVGSFLLETGTDTLLLETGIDDLLLEG